MKSIFSITIAMFLSSAAFSQTDAENKAAQREKDVISGKATEPERSNNTATKSDAIINKAPHEVQLKPVSADQPNMSTGIRSNNSAEVSGSDSNQPKEARPVDNSTVEPRRVERVKLERESKIEGQEKSKKATE
jgi:hypothetical protein